MNTLIVIAGFFGILVSLLGILGGVFVFGFFLCGGNFAFGAGFRSGFTFGSGFAFTLSGSRLLRFRCRIHARKLDSYHIGIQFICIGVQMAVCIPAMERFRNLGENNLALGKILDFDPLETLILGKVLAGDFIFRIFRIHENPLIFDPFTLDLNGKRNSFLFLVGFTLGLLNDFPFGSGQSFRKEGENEAEYEDKAYDTLHVERLLHLNAIYCIYINILSQE